MSFSLGKVSEVGYLLPVLFIYLAPQQHSSSVCVELCPRVKIPFRGSFQEFFLQFFNTVRAAGAGARVQQEFDEKNPVRTISRIYLFTPKDFIGAKFGGQ